MADMRRDTDTDTNLPVSDPAEEEPTSFWRWILETAVMVAIAFLLAQGIKTYVVQPFVVPTGSMEPTIQIGDRFLAEKVSYHFHDPERGDVVVFNDPAGVHPQLVKRVIGLPGEEIDIHDGNVYIDGELLDEPYLHDVVTEPGTELLPTVVPEGYVWVMGDNRPNSGDSRFIGPQPISAIHGRAFGIYWPIGHIAGL